MRLNSAECAIKQTHLPIFSKVLPLYLRDLRRNETVAKDLVRDNGFLIVSGISRDFKFEGFPFGDDVRKTVKFL